MIITAEYRLVERGGYFFRGEPGNGELPGMRGASECARDA